MAKTKTTVPTYTYVVYTDNTCQVTDTATGRPLLTAYPGQPNYFTAYGDSVTLSDDSATILKPVFKCAPDALGLLVGGENLPPGLTRVEFLESTGGQYIKTGLFLSSDSEVSVTCEINGTAGVQSGAVFGSQNEATLQDRAGWSEYTAGGRGWVFWGSVSAEVPVPAEAPRLTSRHTVTLNRSGVQLNGETLVSLSHVGTFATTAECWLFGRNRVGSSVGAYQGKIFDFECKQGGRRVCRFVPCVTAAGEAIMFDTVYGGVFGNDGSGSFVAGVASTAQLDSLLARLSSSPARAAVKTLVLSLPAEANTPEVAEQLSARAEQSGIILTVHEYRSAEAAIATYARRRVREVIWCRKLAAEFGGYVDAAGHRWQVERCSAIFAPDGSDPSDYGYAPFDSVDAAAEHWQLVPYEFTEEETFNI